MRCEKWFNKLTQTKATEQNNGEGRSKWPPAHSEKYRI